MSTRLLTQITSLGRGEGRSVRTSQIKVWPGERKEEELKPSTKEKKEREKTRTQSRGGRRFGREKRKRTKEVRGEESYNEK